MDGVIYRDPDRDGGDQDVHHIDGDPRDRHKAHHEDDRGQVRDHRDQAQLDTLELKSEQERDHETSEAKTAPEVDNQVSDRREETVGGAGRLSLGVSGDIFLDPRLQAFSDRRVPVGFDPEQAKRQSTSAEIIGR